VLDIGAELSEIEVIVINVVLVAIMANAPPAGATVAEGIAPDCVTAVEARQMWRKASKRK
jgi:hypothetical protein